MGCEGKGYANGMPKMQITLLEQAEEEEKMNFESIQALAQIFQAMEEAAKKLENAYNKKDAEEFAKAKKAILEFQKMAAGEIGNGA